MGGRLGGGQRVVRQQGRWELAVRPRQQRTMAARSAGEAAAGWRRKEEDDIKVERERDKVDLSHPF